MTHTIRVVDTDFSSANTPVGEIKIPLPFGFEILFENFKKYFRFFFSFTDYDSEY